MRELDSTGAQLVSPVAFWKFDDCSASRTDLSDASPQGHTAYRTVNLACAPGEGIGGGALTFATSEDNVYVPAQPDFVFDSGLTIALWVKPDSVSGTRTLLRQQRDRGNVFAMRIDDGKFRVILRLDTGRTVAMSAPATAGVWTHVAATHDLHDLRLFVDGSEVSRAKAVGSPARSDGPLLIGDAREGKPYQGLLDEVWLNTAAASEGTIAELTCAFRRPVAVSVVPLANPGVRAGTPVTYTVTIANPNAAVCESTSLESFVILPRGDFYTLEPNTHSLPGLAGGSSVSWSIALASGEEAEPGSYPLTFQVESRDEPALAGAPAQYVVAEPPACHVTPSRELVIRDVSVVDDPVRSQFDAAAGEPRVGAWSFGRLMQNLAPTDAQAAAVTEAVFRSFLEPQTVNGFEIAPRTQMDPDVLQSWPRLADGSLDLARAPLRLLAIASRLDLRDLAHGKAGEGRLMYGVLDRDGQPMLFTVIFEYVLPAQAETGFRAWADAFHALGALPFPSEQYNAALQALTDAFTARGAVPSAPNGSGLLNFRTNEIALALDNQWELREFHLSAETGRLTPATLFLTPERSLNLSPALARFINDNEASILAETHQVPDLFLGAAFSAAAVFNNVDAWDAPGITNPEARHKFSLNTCSGCHGAESGTEFMHVHPRLPGVQSFISRFLTGQSLPDQGTGRQRHFNELRRRRELLEATVCP